MFTYLIIKMFASEYNVELLYIFYRKKSDIKKQTIFL